MFGVNVSKLMTMNKYCNIVCRAIMSWKAAFTANAHTYRMEETLVGEKYGESCKILVLAK